MTDTLPITPVWIIMPVMAGQTMTEAAISDCLAQSVPIRLLVILQGVAGEFRDRIEQIAEQDSRVLVWSHDPPLPSLAATWNRALEFVWAVGGKHALVVNNDVRIHQDTVQVLSTVLVRTGSLFVSAVGVTEQQYDPQADLWNCVSPIGDPSVLLKGGPDFSCFLISKSCHNRFRFDEGYIPAFAEDLDLHRRMMLDGEGDRIFSINLPFHHIGGGSQTIKSLPPKQQQAYGKSREYHARKWGGPVNQERFTIPFGPDSDQDGVTTPELQKLVQDAATPVVAAEGEDVLPTA